MKYDLNEQTLTIYLDGEINSYTAEAKEQEIFQVTRSQTFENLVLDLEQVSYISSAGLRVILKLKKEYENLSLINASFEVYDVFSMTGFVDIMPISKILRKVDVSHATVIGSGFFSTVYQLDKDTIVKVFNRTSDPDQIQRELRLSKEAFVLGIPTAISFDIVQVGDKLGVCFELLDATSAKTTFLKDEQHFHEFMVKYAALLKKINTTECNDPEIPSIKNFYLEKIDKIHPYLEEAYYQKAKRLLESIPERNTFVHGDCHFKNIMIQGGELLLIDMDTLSVGHPLFELAALYAPYCAFSEDDKGNSEKFLGISDEQARHIYQSLLSLYFGKDDEDIYNKLRLVCYIHMVWWNRTNEPDNQIRLEGCRQRLYPLLDRYDDLDIGI
ncbi:MAG: anti-sigma factor antagonist [Bacilli bacterium]|nr:anti-sigma factor antagonist [Bacilli bacterium]